MAATTGQQAAANYGAGVRGVTQEDYCAKQIRLGVSPNVCAVRFQDYQRKVQGKENKWLENWQNG